MWQYDSAMFARLGQFISRYWYLVIAVWLAVVVATGLLAPRWDDVTYDGDLAYMPESMSSVAAERLLIAVSSRFWRTMECACTSITRDPRETSAQRGTH